MIECIKLFSFTTQYNQSIKFHQLICHSSYRCDFIKWKWNNKKNRHALLIQDRIKKIERVIHILIILMLTERKKKREREKERRERI